ncbi:MAG: hypothetical protein IT359_00940 [Gemmatimonadaceae bacterium]|nr:hypothetical protein [Gemmatimonadaceae bacterium]
MNPTIRLALRGAKFMLVGALTASFLGVITFLPGELVATADLPGGSRISLPLVWGVCWACGRVGGVVGLIFFIIRRTLMGEVADPRQASAGGPTVAATEGDALAT